MTVKGCFFSLEVNDRKNFGKEGMREGGEEGKKVGGGVKSEGGKCRKLGSDADGQEVLDGGGEGQRERNMGRFIY